MSKTRNQLISMLQHMKQGNNNNAIKHIKYEDLDAICDYLAEDKQEIEKLEKALDRACEELHSNQAWCHYGIMSKKCGLSKEEWKEELMKDD